MNKETIFLVKKYPVTSKFNTYSIIFEAELINDCIGLYNVNLYLGENTDDKEPVFTYCCDANDYLNQYKELTIKVVKEYEKDMEEKLKMQNAIKYFEDWDGIIHD